MVKNVHLGSFSTVEEASTAYELAAENRGFYFYPSKYYINSEQFINVTKAETAYILGLIWADGHLIYKKIKGTKKTSRCNNNS